MANTLLPTARRDALAEAAHLTRLLNTTEAAAALGIGKRTLQEKVEAREIGCVRIGRCIRFSQADLAAFIERNSVKAVGWKGGAK